MTFVKYPKIEDLSKRKTFQRYLDQYPELYHMSCVIQEKIDGSNVQFYFDEADQLHVGKRSGFLDRNDSFQGIWNVVDNEYTNLHTMALNLKEAFDGQTVRLYGELFGEAVQKRIDYGSGQKVIVFDALVDDECYVPYNDLVISDDSDLVVKDFGMAKFGDPQIDVEKLVSHYSPSGQNVEGIVLKPEPGDQPLPVDKGNGHRIAMKIKSERFSEKAKKPKKTQGSELSAQGQDVKEDFESLINENRVLSVFSKEGQIEDESQIGEYIKLVLEDAKADFFDEYDDGRFRMLPEKEKKAVFKGVGPIVVPILKNYL